MQTPVAIRSGARRRLTGPLAGALAAALVAGCAAPTATPDTVGPQAHALGVERTLYRHSVDFPDGRAEVPAGEAAALRRFLADSGGDRQATVLVTAAAGAGDRLAERRRQAVERQLRRQGFQPQRRDPLLDGHPAPGADVLVRLARYHVVLPGCPDLSRTETGDNANLPSSNFGCSDRRNLGLMVANPRDLLRGRKLGPVSGARTARPVRAYHAGKSYNPVSPGDREGADSAPDAESAGGDYQPLGGGQ